MDNTMDLTLHFAKLTVPHKDLPSNAYTSFFLCIDENDMSKLNKHFGYNVYSFGYGIFSEQFIKVHFNNKRYYLVDICSLSYIKSELKSINDSLTDSELNDITILMMQIDILKGGIINMTNEYFKSIKYRNTVFDSIIKYIDDINVFQIDECDTNEISRLF